MVVLTKHTNNNSRDDKLEVDILTFVANQSLTSLKMIRDIVEAHCFVNNVYELIIANFLSRDRTFQSVDLHQLY